MVNSMTAFARYEINHTWGRLSWEIRSLNQRYLDIYINIPNNFYELSMIIRKKMKNYIFRGKIECTLQIDMYHHNKSESFIINKHLISNLITAAQWIKTKINEGKIDPLGILRYPGVISYEQHNLRHINDELLISFEQTLTQLMQNKKKEGFFLKEQITKRLRHICEEIDSINQNIPEVLHRKRKKLLEQMQSICIDVDTIKLEQELLIIIQKIDISEEIDRLIIHVREMHHILDQEGPVGRRLDFIAQELQREANTLTSKSIDPNITHLAISLKVFIEQIREQVQNIE